MNSLQGAHAWCYAHIPTEVACESARADATFVGCCLRAQGQVKSANEHVSGLPPTPLVGYAEGNFRA